MTPPFYEPPAPASHAASAILTEQEAIDAIFEAFKWVPAMLRGNEGEYGKVKFVIAAAQDAKTRRTLDDGARLRVLYEWVKARDALADALDDGDDEAHEKAGAKLTEAYEKAKPILDELEAQEAKNP